jgi:hypothetical protein
MECIMSLQDRLEHEEQEIRSHETAKRSLDVCITSRREAIRGLKQQIAEEKKPKLRHGDYGLYVRNGDTYKFYVDKAGTLQFEVRQAGWSEYANQPLHETAKVIRQGNIFDDLKALQEDVTEFEIEGQPVKDGVSMEDLSVKTNPHHLVIDQGDDRVTLTHDKVPAFILKLRQMEMTMKRKESK